MNKKIVAAAVLLRVSLGWFMFFAGLGKIIDPAWSAKSFLLGAKTFSDFYAWFALPANLWWVDPLNEWGLFFVGLALLLGVSIRFASFAGAAFMVLYYFPHLTFPYVSHSFLVEEHVIYALAFMLVAFLPHAHMLGLSAALKRTPLGKIPLVRSLL